MIKRLSKDIRSHRERSAEPIPRPSSDSNTATPVEDFSPVGLPIMHSFMNGATKTQNSPLRTQSPSSATIRAVPAEPSHLDAAPSRINGTNGDSRRIEQTHDSAPVGTSKSYANMAPPASPTARQNGLPVPNGLVRSISSEFGPVKTFSASASTDQGNCIASPTEVDSRTAQTGKSGRVINQLITDNNMLRRELQVSQLRLEESKNAVKMAEAKREQMATSMERDAQAAAYNSMQLKRRERLLTEAKEHIEYEKRRAADAEAREKAWKDQLEEFRENATRDVTRAKEKAAQLEASYSTLRGHWPAEQTKVDRIVSKWKVEIAALNKARKEDDEKILLLRSLGEQQAKLMAELQRQNEALRKSHEQYKDEQENGLRNIKEKLRRQEEDNERLLEQNRQTLGKLRWALAVKENVKDAQ